MPSEALQLFGCLAAEILVEPPLWSGGRVASFAAVNFLVPAILKRRILAKEDKISLVKLFIYFFLFHLLVQMNHSFSCRSIVLTSSYIFDWTPFSSVELDIWYMYVPNNIR